MVRAHLPEGVVTAHAVVANQRVHDGLLKAMPHVQGPRDVGRRDRDAISRALPGRRKIASGFPLVVPARFDVCG